LKGERQTGDRWEAAQLSYRYVSAGSTYYGYYTGQIRGRLMMCPECKTTLIKDDRKWMQVIVGLEERSLAVYSCPNTQCSRWLQPVLKNKDTGEPHRGPLSEDNVDLIESVYA
jgi:hypothetical protein